MDILQALEEDVEDMSLMFDRLEKDANQLMAPDCGDTQELQLSKDIADVLRTLDRKMEEHQSVESRLLFPEIKRRTDEGRSAMDGLERDFSQLNEKLHQFAGEIPELAHGPARRLGWKVKTLVAPLRRRLRWESQSVLALAKRCIPESRLEDLERDEQWPEWIDTGGGD